MPTTAMEDTCLERLITMALPVLQEAERRSPRTRPGRKPQIPDWLIAILIMIAVLKRKKGKSAQYRYLCEYRRQIAAWLGTDLFPSRSTYFERYRGAHRRYQQAIRVQGQQVVEEGLADPTTVAVDKSLVAGRGPSWYDKHRQAGRIAKGLPRVDPDIS